MNEAEMMFKDFYKKYCPLSSYDQKHHMKQAFLAALESERARSRELIAEIREGYNCIRTTSYSEENGKRCMDGNEYPWIDRGLKMIKDALVEYHGSDKKDEV